MSTLTQFIETARLDRPVYICDVRDAFQREGTRPFHFHVTLYDDSVRRFALKVPHCEGAEESAFVASFLNAMLYNALSSLGAKRIDVYIDLKDAPLAAWAKDLDEAFQVDAPLATRSGYGKCLNVNQRTLAALCGPEARFAFRLFDIADEPEVPEPHPAPTAIPVFAALPERAKRGMLMGMDIGGTDVKLVAALDGRLVAFKEYDWNPAACALAEQLIEPLCLLTRLMRAAVCMEASGLGDRVPAQVFDRAATDGEMASAVTEMEARLGDRLRGFDGIGLCFPDVVIRNRIIGGETHKTYGMRMNRAVDYEAQFAKITNLCDVLKAYATPEGVVMNTNDGPMAAFTTAVEQAAAGTDLSDGFFAHTLGTELGTGWILPDGSIPEIPLEVYNFIIDLGSFDQRRFPAPDVRSINNVNTGLPGTLQKYTSQSGVFRLAANSLPDAAPKVFQGALDRGLFVKDGRAPDRAHRAEGHAQALPGILHARSGAAGFQMRRHLPADRRIPGRDLAGDGIPAAARLQAAHAVRQARQDPGLLRADVRGRAAHRAGHRAGGRGRGPGQHRPDEAAGRPPRLHGGPVRPGRRGGVLRLRGAAIGPQFTLVIRPVLIFEHVEDHAVHPIRVGRFPFEDR